MENMIDYPIVVRNLDWSYGQEKILDNINIKFEEGKFYSIIGPNGSGKTTLIKNISKLLEIKKESVFVNKCDLTKLSSKEFAKKISCVPQNTNIDFEFSVIDIVLMGRAPYLRRFQSESKDDLEIVKRAMEITNTWYLKDKRINEISGGERQRVIIARAIAQNTRIILLDEPISHLDIHHQVELLDTIRKLNEENNITVIAILHDLNMAAEYSDELILLSKGKIVAKGIPKEVLTKENIKQVYNIEINLIKNPVTKKPYIIPVFGASHQG